MLQRWWWLLALLSTAAGRLPSNHPVSNNDEEVEYNVYVGKWKSCEWNASPSDEYWNDVARAGTKTILKHTIQLGIQYRDLECRGMNSKVMNDSFCEPEISKIGRSRVCIFDADCLMDEWNPWRPRPDGSQVRIRKLSRLQQGRGKECEVIEEVKPVILDPTAHWVPGPWGACKVAVEQPTIPTPSDDDEDDADEDNAIYEELDRAEELEQVESGPGCGGGVQRREAACAGAAGDLHPAHCAHTPLPTLVQPCEVPCPRDCEIGEWGEWSPCQPTDGCPLFPVQQLTSAGYSVRRRRVVSAASGGGAPCPPLEEKRACSNPKCASWRALPWGPCVLAQAHAACGPGRRTRDLQCIGHDGKEAQRAWCSTGAPARSERCRIACPGDCVLSSWGAWTPCSAPCANSKHQRPFRTRRRHILAHSSPKGWQCPLEEQLIQNETCNAHACATYSWLATPWGPCERRDQDFVPTNYTDIADSEPFVENDEEEPCIEEGEMSRDVMCVQNNADVVREALCSPLRRPAARRACTARCRRGCRLEAWQPWTACPNTCSPSKQSRTRVVHGGPSCGPRAESRACPLPPSCLVEQVQWTSNNWSACKLAKGQSCGFGFSVRSVWCAAGARRVEAGLCAGAAVPPRARRCRVPCLAHAPPTCRQVCAHPLKYLDSAEPDIPTCVCKNVTLELLPTDSDCILPPGSECGEGNILRAARCLLSGFLVPMDVCKKYHPLTGPFRVREATTDGYEYSAQFPGLVAGACSVRCARDCAAGAWAAWGPCAAEPAARTAFRYRTREVVEEGAGGGRECGGTLQRATCSADAPRWQLADWSACAPERALCGHAIQTRSVRCVDGDGNVLEDSVCQLAGAGAAPAREAPCRAPCPADCVVSAWSDWSPCEQTKWGGRRDRTRVVLRPGEEGGAPCPPLVAGEGCSPDKYSWHIAPWDDCQPLGGSPCGEGIKRRAVRCLRSDGVFVNDTLCPNSTSGESKQSWCYVPCGVDCELGEWGAWDTSACSCGGGGDGVQHMRRTRQQLTAAVWPGRACPPAEQRAPCPRLPCLAPRVPPPSLACRFINEYGEDVPNACGWGVRVSEPRCEVHDEWNSQLAPAQADQLALSPGRCGAALPGRMVLTPDEYQEEPCEVACGCAEVELSAAEWGAWGPCRGGARSRSRQMPPPHTLRCRTSSKYMTIQWENCDEYEDSDPPMERRPRRQHSDDDDDQIIMKILALLFLSFISLLIIYISIKICQRISNYVTNKQQMDKLIAKV